MKNLSIVGILGTVVGSYFQYVSWQEQNNITRFKEDYQAAHTTFTGALKPFAAMTRMQQSLFFAYRYTAQRNETNPYVKQIGADTYKDYVTTKTDLSKTFSMLAIQIETDLDWLTEPETNARSGIVRGDPLSVSTLGAYDFDCDKYVPDYSSFATLSRTDIPPSPRQLKENSRQKSLTIDWHSAKHQIITLYYCLTTIDSGLRPAQEWASGTTVDSDQKARFFAHADDLEKRLDTQVSRLNSFIRLATWRIERLRQRTYPRGFFCHVSGWCS